MGIGKKSEPLWRQAFAGVVRQALAANKKELSPEQSFEESCEALRNMDGAKLLEFDRRARRSFGNFVNQTGARTSAVLRMALDERDHSDIFLFFGSCDGNGYIREQALRAMRGYAGKLACAAALIRTEDWVPQVAEIASRLLDDLAETDNGKYFFELLDLIAILQSRQRFKQHWSALEPMLLDPRWREARLAARSGSKAMARRLAHDLILRADPNAARDSLRLAISDSTPMVALWALAKLRDSANAEDQQELLREGLRSGLSSIRSDSLRRYCRGQFQDVRTQLELALLDRSRSVRGVAAHHFEDQFGDSALERWREAFDANPLGEAMITAISDFGIAADETRLRRCLVHPRGRVRALALRGLTRIGVTDTEALLAAALTEKSALVVGAAVAAYARGISALTIENLQHALASAGTANLRMRLISASRLLLKWERLEFLLTQYPKCSDGELEHLDQAVQAWIVNANRSFTTPPPARRSSIAAALDTAKKLRPARHWEKVSHLL